MADGFKASNLAIQAQKKLLTKMSSKGIAKMFIEDEIAKLLDDLYHLFKLYIGKKKDAEKLIKYIISTVIKIGILSKNNRFNEEELNESYKLRKTFTTVIMTISSFYELDYSYDYNYLTKQLNQLELHLKNLLQNHLKEKSLLRISMVFQFCTKQHFLDSIFKTDQNLKQIMGQMVSNFNKIVE